MKHFFLLLTACLIHTVIYSQNKNLLIKSYLIAQYQYEEYEDNSGNQEDARFTIAPTVAFSLFTAKGNFHEVEIQEVNFTGRTYSTDINDRVIQGAETNRFYARISYEYNFLVNKQSSNTQVFIGLGLTPFIEQSVRNPLTSSSFQTQSTMYGATALVVPHLNIRLTEKLLLDVKIPIALTNFQWQRQRVINPSIPIRQQINSAFMNEWLPYRIGMGIGLAYRL